MSFCRNILPESFKQEAKSILKFSWPLVISNISDFVIPVVSLPFLGHYGESYLAAAGLAVSFCNLCGLAIIIGLDSATQTLCSQSYGAKNYRMYGIIIQRAMVVQMFATISLLPLWINAERIFIGLGQNKEISRLAGQFILWRIPSLVFQGLYKTLQSYLICQHISLPLVVIGLIGVVVSVILNYLLVSHLKLGVIGSALSVNFAFLFLCLLVFAYVYKKKILHTWPGLSSECLFQWKQFVLLALPGSLMILFDWGTGEIGVFLMGVIGRVELASQSIVLNITAISFMLPLAISTAATVKVGSFMGSSEPRKAKNMAKSCLVLTWLFGFLLMIILTSTKDYVSRIFSNSKNVINEVIKIIPLTGAFHILDGSQGVLAGILRGLGMQKHGAISNFIGLDLIGLPLGSVFSFVLKWNVLGFWIGLAIGMAVQVVMMLLILAFSDWQKLSDKARDRVVGEAQSMTSFGDDLDKLIDGRTKNAQNLDYVESLNVKEADLDSSLTQSEMNPIAAYDVDISDTNERITRLQIFRRCLIFLFPIGAVIGGILARVV